MKRVYLPNLLKLKPTIFGLSIREFFILGNLMVLGNLLIEDHFITLCSFFPIYGGTLLAKKYLQPRFFVFHFKKKEILPYEIKRN